MTISFAGHADILSGDHLKETLRAQLRPFLTANRITCYFGGYGGFDELCASVCRELKKEYPAIELVYVTPYLHPADQEKVKALLRQGLYDASVYPPIEHVHPRLAILKRNEWMMQQADMVIVYVNRSFGGAYRSLRVAQRAKKTVINVCDFL